MGDSACLMHGFSYASAIPNDSNNGNTMHALGESISFGRFTTDSLSWEKWSTFSHKKYVEEAERYAQPGSVAEKKAFFEAHYKRIAAKKAADLLEQQQSAANILQAEEIGDSTNAYEGQIDIIDSNNSYVDVKMEEARIQDVNLVEIGNDGENGVITANESSSENPLDKKSVNQLLDNLEKQDTVSESESRGTSIMDRGLLKNSVAKDVGFSSMKSPIQSKTWEVPSTPIKPVVSHLNKENNIKSRSTNKYSSLDSFDKRRSSPNSLRALLNLFPNNECEEDPISATKKAEKLGILLRTPQQDCATPLSTPGCTKVVSTYPAAKPQSANKRITTPLDPPVQGTGSKWHILSAVCSKSLTACKKKLQSPTLSTPFILRTEERASKREQKLEDKFKASDTQKMQLQKTLKERAGNEISKLGCSFCFKARPSPDFYKERETPKDHMKKIPAAQSQSAAALGGNISNETQGTISLPSATKNLQKKNVLPNQKKLHTQILTERITHENASPNIRQ